MLLNIFGGSWVAGDRLREEKLAALFEVSRTPIRETLQELAAVGLVELRPNCGAVVAAFGPRELEEIYEVRALLEAEATQLACESIPHETLRDLQSELSDLLSVPARTAHWSRRAWDADRRLHGLIVEHCPNRRLAREIARYDTFVQIVRETVGNRDRAQDAAIEEHLAIVRPMIRGNGEKAAAAMRAHIRIAGEAAVEALGPILLKRKSR